MTDSLFKIGKAMKKPLIDVLKKTGKKVAEKGINKASDVVVKNAGDKIGNILRKRKSGQATKRPTKPKNDAMVRLNQLIASL